MVYHQNQDEIVTKHTPLPADNTLGNDQVIGHLHQFKNTLEIIHLTIQQFVRQKVIQCHSVIGINSEWFTYHLFSDTKQEILIVRELSQCTIKEKSLSIALLAILANWSVAQRL